MTNIGSDEKEFDINDPRRPSVDSTNTANVINEHANALYFFI